MDEMELFKKFLEFKKMLEQPQQKQEQTTETHSKQKKKSDKIKLQKLDNGGVLVNLNTFNFRIQKYKDNYYLHLKIAPFIKRNSKGVYTMRLTKEEVECIISAMNIIKMEMDNVIKSDEVLKQQT